MRTIVAPTDFSGISLNAVKYAADLAAVLGTRLSLIHVCYLPIPVSEVAGPSISLEELVESAEEQMNQLKDVLLKKMGNSIEVDTIIRLGDVVSGIDEYCHSVEAFAVVMGAESDGAFARAVSGGGKTIMAMKKFSWPLIVVPPDVKFVSIRKIGLACDFRRGADTIPVTEIKKVVNEFHAEFHVLHVNTDAEEMTDPEPVEEKRWLEEILGDMHPIFDFIEGSDIEKGITEFAEKNNFDLLIVVPKKHSLVNKIMEHSRSRRMVLYSHVPVMAIHG